MDAALDNILDILDSNTETDLAIAEVLNVQPPEVNIPIEPIFVEAYPFNSDSNVANIDVRAAFAVETVYRETELFTKPIPTTITIEGFISNLDFHEQEIINDIEPNCEIVQIKCNYGNKIYPGYQPPLPPKKSNRGRKKNPIKERKRRKQGTGDCFNSQITFVMPSSKTQVIGGVVPSDAEVYKFKIFRTGKIQLPGLKDASNINDVLELTQRVVDFFDNHFYGADLTKSCRLINLNTVMKNYKFKIKVPRGHIINLRVLHQVLEYGNNGSKYPPVFDVKWSRQETKLSVKFSTPLPNDPIKRVLVNIFPSGKVNILGGHVAEVTSLICEYLNAVFDQYDLFARLGSHSVATEDNISSEPPPVDDCEPLAYEHPIISEAEYTEILDMIARAHHAYYEEVGECLRSLGLLELLL